MERGPIASTLLEENAWIHGSLVSATEEVGGGGGDLAAEVLLSRRRRRHRRRWPG